MNFLSVRFEKIQKRIFNKRQFLAIEKGTCVDSVILEGQVLAGCGPCNVIVDAVIIGCYIQMEVGIRYSDVFVVAAWNYFHTLAYPDS